MSITESTLYFQHLQMFQKFDQFADFDGDDMLGVNDLRQVIDRLTGPEQVLADRDMQHLIQNILDEADLDDDGALSFAEFEHVVTKSPDFTR